MAASYIFSLLPFGFSECLAPVGRSVLRPRYPVGGQKGLTYVLPLLASLARYVPVPRRSLETASLPPFGFKPWRTVSPFFETFFSTVFMVVFFPLLIV